MADNQQHGTHSNVNSRAIGYDFLSVPLVRTCGQNSDSESDIFHDLYCEFPN